MLPLIFCLRILLDLGPEIIAGAIKGDFGVPRGIETFARTAYWFILPMAMGRVH